MPTPDRAPRPPATDLSAIFRALADPVRRGLVERLVDEPQLTPTGLAAGLPITRQAVAKHLAALSAAGLVIGTRSGRQVHYEVSPEPLADAAAWIGAVGAEWDERLSRLQRVLSRGPSRSPST